MNPRLVASVLVAVVLVGTGCGIGVGDRGPVSTPAGDAGVVDVPGVTTPATIPGAVSPPPSASTDPTVLPTLTVPPTATAPPSVTGTPTTAPLATPTARLPAGAASDPPPAARTAEPPRGSRPPATTDASPPPRTPSPRPASPPAPTPVPTAEPSTGEPIAVMTYLFLPPSRAGRQAELVPVGRIAPRTRGVGAAAVRALLAGPTAGERSAGMSTSVPPHTLLLGLAIADGVATVDLSTEFGAGGDQASVTGRFAQVVYTLTQFPTVRAVRFRLDGEPAPALSGDGLVLDRPATRDDYLPQLPLVFVDSPGWGTTVRPGSAARGRANTFEATFVLQLRDGADAVLFEEIVTATCGSGCWGDFDVPLRFRAERARPGALVVFTRSAADGSIEDLRRYSVRIGP